MTIIGAVHFCPDMIPSSAITRECMVTVPRRGGMNLQVTLYTTQPTQEITTEAVIFNGVDLIASVGGYLGLYLGASILSIYHLVAKAGERCFCKSAIV